MGILEKIDRRKKEDSTILTLLYCFFLRFADRASQYNLSN